MDDALRKGARPRFFEVCELGGQERLQFPLHLVGAFAAILVQAAPTLERKRVGALLIEVEPGAMQLCERFTESSTMRGRGPADPHAVQKGDHGRRSAGDAAEHLTLL